MAADDYMNASGKRLLVQRLQIVQHVHAHAADFGSFELTNLAGPLTIVIVAANGDNGSNRTQHFQDFKPADVAGMKNEINAFEQRYHFRTQKPMGVGYDTNNLLSALSHYGALALHNITMQTPVMTATSARLLVYVISSSAYLAIIFLRP